MPNCLQELLANPEQADAFLEDFLGMAQADVVDVDSLFAGLKSQISQQRELTPQLVRLVATHSALSSFCGRLESDLLEPFYRHGMISLKTAIMAAKSQSLDFDMCDAFVALAPHLDPQQLEDAIATVETLKDDYRRQMALAPLYSHLEESALTEKAVALYPKLISKQHSSELHVRYWPLLPSDIRHAAILNALDDAIIMKMQPYATAEYLLRIIPWLSVLSSDELCRWLLKWMMVAQPATSGEQLERLQSLELEEAIEEVAILANKLALQGFPRLYNSAERSFLVTGAIQYLPEGSQSDAIASWLNRLYESNKPENQAGGLAGLAPYLEGEVRKRAIVDAWSAAQQIESPDKRALLMSMIARQMPGEQQPEKMREALRSLGNYRYMSASKAILNALPSFPRWGVKLILEQEYRFSQHIDDDLYMRIARVAFRADF